jgi:hypothetical protein
MGLALGAPLSGTTPSSTANIVGIKIEGGSYSSSSGFSGNGNIWATTGSPYWTVGVTAPGTSSALLNDQNGATLGNVNIPYGIWATGIWTYTAAAGSPDLGGAVRVRPPADRQSA